MNDKKLEDKVRQDAAKVKKDFDTLVKDTSIRLGKFENQATKTADKAKVELAARVEENLVQLNKDFEKFLDGASTVKKDVGQSLSKVNAKAQKIIHKKSNDAARKTAILTWGTVSLALVVGFVAFILFRPVPKPVV